MSKGHTTIVIGNGFDLDLGWKTSYGDFYTANCWKYKEYLKNVYIEKMIKGEQWSMLEEYMRRSLIEWDRDGREEDKKEHLHYFWIITRNLLYSYFIEQEESFAEKVNKESCAYLLLTKLHKDIFVLSFNYTDPYKYIDKSMSDKYNDVIINHLHGSLYDEFPTYAKILLGIDTGISSVIKNDKDIEVLVKRLNKEDENRSYIELLSSSEHLVFFGHSLGITDSDYFKPAFEKILKENSLVKKITIITCNEGAANNIRQNTMQWGIDLDEIDQYVPIKYIYTKKGANDKDFMELLATL